MRHKEGAGEKPPRSQGDVTGLLQRWAAGDAGALEELVPLVYGELRELASHYLRAEGRAVTVQPTDLSHEVFLRLIGRPPAGFADRHHFFGIAARLVRQVLVDHARARRAGKRGGGAVALDLTAAELVPGEEPTDILAVEQALERLGRLDPALERLVELRFYGGLTIEEAALATERSPASLKRDWAIARAFLHRELGGGAVGT